MIVMRTLRFGRTLMGLALLACTAEVEVSTPMPATPPPPEPAAPPAPLRQVVFRSVTTQSVAAQSCVTSLPSVSWTRSVTPCWLLKTSGS